MTDIGIKAPFCPNILTMKTNIALPPPGIISHSDFHSHRRRRVQHISKGVFGYSAEKSNGAMLKETSRLKILSYRKIAQHISLANG